MTIAPGQLVATRWMHFSSNSEVAKLVSISDSQPIQSRIGTAGESIEPGWSMIACALPMKLCIKSCGCSQLAGGASPDTIKMSRRCQARDRIGRKCRLYGYAVAAEDSDTRRIDRFLGFMPRSIMLSRICTCPCGCMLAPMQPNVICRRSPRRTIAGRMLWRGRLPGAISFGRSPFKRELRRAVVQDDAGVTCHCPEPKTSEMLVMNETALRSLSTTVK